MNLPPPQDSPPATARPRPRRGWLAWIPVAGLALALGALQLQPATSPRLTLLQSHEGLLEASHRLDGSWRLIALLSPTSPDSRAHADWLWGILRGSRRLPIQALIVWQADRPQDDQEAALLSTDLLPDPRARHFWDPGRSVGRWLHQEGLRRLPALLQEQANQGGVVRESYLLLAPGARLTPDAPPPALAGTLADGRPLLGEALLSLLERAQAAPR